MKIDRIKKFVAVPQTMRVDFRLLTQLFHAFQISKKKKKKKKPARAENLFSLLHSITYDRAVFS